MGPTKAPRENGLPGLFYQKYWPIVGDKITGFCLHLLNGDMESAFVPGRLISDNMLLAYEILNTLKQKRMGKKGFMTVKLDMSKAYDRVQWDFIKQIMIRMGFATRWIEIIMKCITTVSYSVVMNGQLGVKFQPHKGLRQGDPLSPFLFLLCGEGLSSLIRIATREGLLKGVKASRNGPPISHLLFADDCILFEEATRKGAHLFKDILQEYRLCSGQYVNFDKSTVFFSKNTREEDRQMVVSLLGVRSSSEPSIWAAKGLLQKGLCWRIGRGNKVYIWKDCWIQGVESLERQNSSDNAQLELVSDLIDRVNRKWKEDLISNTFHSEVARKILQTSLSESDHEDFQVWRDEPTGEYSVRSTYKLLQNANLEPNNYLLQTENKKFFGKLWNLQLPSKITVIIWRIAWNYILTLANLRYRRIVTNAVCPRCGYGEEDCHHIFRQCPLMYEYSSGIDLAQKVQNHMAENEGVRPKQSLSNMVYNQRIVENLPIIKIQFDAAFDTRNFRSVTGLLVWEMMNEYLASKSILHNNITSPFTAEAYAGLEAVKLGIEMSFQEIQILGDSLTAHPENGKHDTHNIAKDTLKRSERVYLEDVETNRHNGGVTE
ncbi:hypothetical protein CXB51_032213 [Gossypium anomalum]|uniref:Reverse transcriptase domain-containing protein n=1 Tax=Gossypium anomalum TaxID=47600 RepID=A0A8J5YDL4_9ROSI|nr:hypothetical protein CXB51_032213 [Gossypium anomalum]